MEFTRMIRQEQGKRNHHKEEILISSSATHAILSPSTGSLLWRASSAPSAFPLDLIGKNPIFACWQLSNMPWFNMHCASVPGWKKTTNLTVFKSAYWYRHFQQAWHFEKNLTLRSLWAALRILCVPVFVFASLPLTAFDFVNFVLQFIHFPQYFTCFCCKKKKKNRVDVFITHE